MDIGSYVLRLVEVVTGTERYRPVFEWSRKCHTHNFFRFLEHIVGKKYGPPTTEWSARVDKFGRAHVNTHTWEAFFAYTESAIREFFARFKIVPVYINIPQLVPVMGPMRVRTPYLFAIIYNNSAVTPFGASPQTVSLTNSGSDTAMVMYPTTLLDTSTAPTYNSVAATAATGAVGSYIGGGRFGVRGYYLIAPATGNNTASFGSGASVEGFLAVYSGVNQYIAPDSVGVVNTGSVPTITVSVTTLRRNCVVTMCEVDSGAGTSPDDTPGSGVTAVRTKDLTLAGCIADGLATSIGSNSFTINLVGGTNPTLSSMVAIALAPVPPPNEIELESTGFSTWTNSGASVTISRTISSYQNTFLAVGFATNGTVSSVTDDGNPMTVTASAGGAQPVYFATINKPTAGTKNIIITLTTGGNFIYPGFAVYTGVRQNFAPDVTNSNSAGSGTSITTTLSTIEDKSFGLTVYRNDNDGISTAGTGSRQVLASAGFVQIYDSNGPKTPAGSLSMTTTNLAGPTSISQFMISLPPAPSKSFKSSGLRPHAFSPGNAR